MNCSASDTADALAGRRCSVWALSPRGRDVCMGASLSDLHLRSPLYTPVSGYYGFAPRYYSGFYGRRWRGHGYRGWRG